MFPDTRASRPSPAIWMTRLGLVLMTVWLAACRAETPIPPAPPERIGVSPLEDATEVGDAGLPGVVPTWTLPAGGERGTPAPGPRPNPVPGPGNVAAPPGAPPGSPREAEVGAIPVPSARAARPVPQAGPPATDPEIVSLLGQVSPVRLSSDVNRLVGFGTRNAFSTIADPKRGVGAARDWLKAEFEQVGSQAGRQVLAEFEDFGLVVGAKTTTQRNVIATLPGIGLEKRLVYLTSHYDSRIEDVNNGTSDAPGADDNASGTAALLELARVMGRRQWDATLRLVAFAAEEQGLKGSRHHAPLAKQMGLPIVAVFNNDIIGSAAGADGASDPESVRVFSAPPADGPSRQLARYAQVVAARYGLLKVNLIPEADRAGRGSDHQSFSELGFPAIRLIESTEDLDRQHNPRDTTDRIQPRYLADVVRLDVALAANLALAPVPPAGAPTLEAKVPGELHVTWSAATGTHVAGYYVAWRPDGELAYQALVWAGQATALDLTELAGLPDQKIAVAVAASDDLGHLSLFGPEAHGLLKTGP